MPGLEDAVAIEITKPLPATGVADTTYKIKGSAKMFDAVGAFPLVYAEIRYKEWFKPEFAEEVKYERGFPIPITGDFSIDFKPEKEGEYEITVVATPAPLPLPIIGVVPITGRSDLMKMAIEAAPPTGVIVMKSLVLS